MTLRLNPNIAISASAIATVLRFVTSIGGWLVMALLRSVLLHWRNLSVKALLRFLVR